MAPQNVQIVRVLHDNLDQLTSLLGPLRGSDRTILKFSSSDDFHAQPGVYDDSNAIQGTMIPKLYGIVYSCVMDNGQATCLVLERFGDEIEVHFEDLETWQKCVNLQN